MRPLAWLGGVVAIACTALPAGDGILALQGGGASIRGRVHIAHPEPVPPPRPTASDPGARRADREHRQAVVYFETAPRGAFEGRESSPRATMDQRNEMFVPHLLAITVGTTVDFPNSDRTYHNVFSLSRPRRFDLGRYAAGRSKAVRFDRPGIVRVFCDIHSHMNAFVLVFSHRFFAVTDREGRFEIAGVPPGSYTLSAWYEGRVRDQRSLTVPANGRAIDLDFVVP
jgi:plastocyanin